jgi:hypothetical protein
MRRGRHERTHGSAEQQQTRKRDDGDERKEQPELNQALGALLSGEDHVRYLPALVQTLGAPYRYRPDAKIVLLGYSILEIGHRSVSIRPIHSKSRVTSLLAIETVQAWHTAPNQGDVGVVVVEQAARKPSAE